uniref:Uncharacterized protein n=1 Tax=Acidianus brierleyi TaxID=41673 RepID=A0A2U9IFQ3_9CREN
MMKKGLSAPIGMIFVLMIMIAIIIPLTYYINSMPSNEAQAQENAQPYFTQAQEQLQEFGSDVGFYEGNHNIYLVIYQNPPIPIIVKHIIDNNKVINENIYVISSNANANYGGYPTIKIPLSGNISIVTQLGNIVYPQSLPLNSEDGDPKINIQPDSLTLYLSSGYIDGLSLIVPLNMNGTGFVVIFYGIYENALSYQASSIFLNLTYNGHEYIANSENNDIYPGSGLRSALQTLVSCDEYYSNPGYAYVAYIFTNKGEYIYYGYLDIILK